jgi:hypothetical protein
MSLNGIAGTQYKGAMLSKFLRSSQKCWHHFKTKPFATSSFKITSSGGTRKAASSSLTPSSSICMKQAWSGGARDRLRPDPSQMVQLSYNGPLATDVSILCSKAHRRRKGKVRRRRLSIGEENGSHELERKNVLTKSMLDMDFIIS